MSTKNIGTLVVLGVLLGIWGLMALIDGLSGGGSEQDQGYPRCSQFGNSYPSYDAKCIDTSGDLVYYRDTDQGRYLKVEH